jgi:hypothetical protein
MHRGPGKLSTLVVALLLVGGTALAVVGPAASETLGPLPTAKTEAPFSVGPRGALLGGMINPNGYRVSYWIAFGRKRPSEHHTNLSEEEFVGHEPLQVEEFADQLPEGTVYRYRLVVLWAHGTKMAYGAERAFRTKCWVENSKGGESVAPCRR